MPDDAPPSPEQPAEPQPRRCRCGHDRHHYMVSAVYKYTAWGWFWLTLVGASATPIHAVFRCRICGDAIDEVDDPAELAKLF